jgi:DNA gyrase subunit B
MQEYARGKKKAAVKKVGTTKARGTVVTFQPDPEIFKEGTSFDWEKIVERLKQQAYLVKGLRIDIIDLRGYAGKIDLDKAFYLKPMGYEAPSMTFYFEGGLVSFVRSNNAAQKPIHKNVFYVEKANDNGESVEIALQYVDDISPRIMPFANNIYTPEGGTHVTGFRTALTRTLNTYARKNNLVKEEDSFTGEDVQEGLAAVISVKLREIQFEGQTKAKLGSMEAQGMVATVFGDAFATFLEENPDDGKAIVQKVVLAVKARKAAKAAKDSILRKGALEGMTLPGKLADCQSGTSAEDAELFIVEGDSAGGTAKTGRDRKTQAILPLRGKILNIERARLDRMLASEQIKNLVIALGTAIGDTFDITKLRYHKIIIATDADVDGAHIRTLLLTLFYRHFRALIEGGFVYIAQPPLYKIKKGKGVSYAYSDEEKNKLVGKDEVAEETEGEEGEVSEEEAAEKEAAKSKKISIQRYKGLGEMNPEELWETTMDPERRILKQVSIEDAQDADRVFDILMGTDVPARKSFIQSNAKAATLDI